jgi:serine/threonine protein kinase
MEDQEFRDLFWKMVRVDPSGRPTVEEIRNHPWIKGPYYSEEKVYQNIMKRLF